MSARARGWPLGLAALVAAGSFVHAACGGAQSGGGATAPGASGTSSAAPSASGSASSAGASAAAGAIQPEVVEVDGVETDVFPCTVETREPCYEHANHVADVIGEMVEVEDEQDQRSIELANEAIDSSDALVHEEGLRLLGQFSRDCNVAKGALSSLIDPHPTIQAMAARVLDRCSDTSDLGKQWVKGHPIDPNDIDSYDHQPKIDPSIWGFAAYAGAQPYPPGYSLHGVAFSTHDDVATVANFYAQSLGAPATDASEIKRREDALTNTMADRMKAMEKQMQPLMQQYMKTHDPKILEQVKKLSENQTVPEMTDLSEGPLGTLNVPSRNSVIAGARFVLVDEGTHKPGRMVAVYREPLYDLTVIQLSWHPKAHPAPIPRPPSIHLHGIAR